jgi:hypothetical protein
MDTDYYYDFPVHVKIKPTVVPDPVDQNINQLTGCTQSVFPLGYAIDATKHVNYGIHVVESDSNKNILLSGKSYMLNSDDGSPGDLQMDGHVMRVTIMGTVQWISYLSTRYNEDEYVAGAIYVGGYVMALYQSNAAAQAQMAKTQSICKITYNEGQLVYAKSIVYLDYMFSPQEIIYKDSSFYIDLD